MSSSPRQEKPDNAAFLASAIANLRAIRQEFDSCLSKLESQRGELSPAEVAFIPEAKAQAYRHRIPAAEIDCDLAGGGIAIGCTLRVYGHYTPTWHDRHRESPDEQASFEVDAVTVSFGADEQELDLEPDDIDRIVDHMMERE